MSNNTNDYELEVWKRLWASRDFELQHFWQRSIFLTAFLVLGFTAYGTFQGAFISKIFDGKICLDSKDMIAIYSAISVFLCCVNMILSVLWIMMAKGSKNAYEVYESALESDISAYPVKNNILKSAYVKLDSKNDTNACILSTKAYRYSVSRINIFLGIFSFFIFSFLVILHVVLWCWHGNIVFGFIIGGTSIVLTICVIIYLRIALKGREKTKDSNNVAKKSQNKIP